MEDETCESCGGCLGGDAPLYQDADICRCLKSFYQFPATRFIRNSLWRQWWHLVSEVLEVGRALLAGNLQHAAAELWDVKHSPETLHRIMERQQVDVEASPVQGVQQQPGAWLLWRKS